jgi:hypothetical protein
LLCTDIPDHCGSNFMFVDDKVYSESARLNR